jgi:OPA family glycerol-3-phosphate transporter-like MFS transporter
VATPSVWTDGEIVQQAVLNFGLQKTSVLWGLAILWAANGYFQSFGALSIIKINAQWFHVGERGTFSAIFGILIRFGLILAFSATPLIVKYTGWQNGFLIPAGFVFIIFLLTLFFVADSPEEAGYPGLDTGDGSGSSTVKLKSAVVIKQVLSSKALWMIGSASMMIGFVRRSVVDAWWPVYYKEYHGVSGDDGIFHLTAWLIAILGIAGGFAFGMTSDRVFGGRRGPVCTIGFVGMASMLAIWALSDSLALGPIAALVCLIGVSFFVNGTHGMVGGAATMDFGGRQAAATAAGMIDGMQYLAGALVGVGCGYITENYDWQVWKLWPIPFAIVGALIMGRLWNVLPKGRGAGH